MYSKGQLTVRSKQTSHKQVIGKEKVKKELEGLGDGVSHPCTGTEPVCLRVLCVNWGRKCVKSHPQTSSAAIF